MSCTCTICREVEEAHRALSIASYDRRCAERELDAAEADEALAEERVARAEREQAEHLEFEAVQGRLPL